MKKNEKSQRAPIAPPHPIECTQMYPSIARSPFKIVYVFFSFIKLGLRTLLWAFQYLIYGAEHPRWNIGTQLFIRAICGFLQIMVEIAKQPPRLFRHEHWSGKRSRFVKIPAASDDYLLGSANTPNAKGEVPEFEPVPGYWYTPPHRTVELLKAAQESRAHSPTLEDGALGVVLFFHGGAYVTFTSQEMDSNESLGRYLVTHTGMDMLAIDYRLAGNYSFPSQLQDAISAYVFLVKKLRVPPSKIIVAGDSAGANLAISLTRYIHEDGHANDLSMPAGILLFSPWADVTCSLATKTQIYHDIVPPDYGKWGSRALLYGHSALTAKDPIISPIFEKPDKLAQILPKRVFISCGGAECLRAEIEELTNLARKGRRGTDFGKGKEKKEYLRDGEDGKTEEENGIVLDVIEGAPHDFATLPLVFLGESKQLIKRVSLWCQDVLS
eukprot:TRINITY_DN5525_c0_g2_i1.p1 TRINITY_DN5525_c0_g2~~TRINITY_DN5525_c0_g2_i1.p1  ORF type:complete len:440 (+),score=124.96 TRINITY_DN5525_c0_g2_i1:120-1439(+)